MNVNSLHWLHALISVGYFRFLKAKVTILQQELDMSHQENAKHLDKIAKVTEQQKKIDGARCQASNTINSLNSQIKKHQQNEANTALKLKVCIAALFREPRMGEKKKCTPFFSPFFPVVFSFIALHILGK